MPLPLLLFFLSLLPFSQSDALWVKPPLKTTVYSDPSGMFSSPSFPDQYPNGVTQKFQIIVSSGDFLHIDFLMFQLELCYDFLYVYDGAEDRGDNLVANLTGNLTGHSIESSGNTMTLVFQSDLTGQRAGFFANYYSVQLGKSYAPSFSCLPTPYTKSFGVLSTPGFPFNYPDNDNCSYKMQAAVGQRILVTFFVFHTETNYDLVFVYDGGQKKVPPLSGEAIPEDADDIETFSILSDSNNLTLVFQSDLTTNFIGVSFLYRFISISDAEVIKKEHSDVSYEKVLQVFKNKNITMSAQGKKLKPEYQVVSPTVLTNLQRSGKVSFGGIINDGGNPIFNHPFNNRPKPKLVLC